MVALFARVAINRSLDNNLARTLSGSYIEQVENLKIPEEFFNLCHKMLYDFIKRISVLKNNNYSKVVIKYILNHISLSDISNYVDLNLDYLREVFKKFTNMTPKQYQNKHFI